jgi:hypothetical protein
MKRKPTMKRAVTTPPKSGSTRALAAAESRVKAAKQQLRLAKSRVKRARKHFKEQKKEVKQLRKRVASERREAQRARSRARARRPSSAATAGVANSGASPRPSPSLRRGAPLAEKPVPRVATTVKKKRARPAPPRAVSRSSVKATSVAASTTASLPASNSRKSKRVVVPSASAADHPAAPKRPRRRKVKAKALEPTSLAPPLIEEANASSAASEPGDQIIDSAKQSEGSAEPEATVSG